MSISAADKPEVSAARPNPFYALHFRNFRLFFFGQMISVAGTWMQSVAEQWLVWSLTHSAAWLGIIAGSSALPYVTFSIWGGQIADRFPRRSILITTQATALLLAVVLAVLATNSVVPIQPWHIALLAGCLGVVNAFNIPAQQAFVVDMVEGSDALPNAIALNSLQFNIARVIGPVVAGVVLVHLKAAGCFALNALSFVAVILSLIAMRLPPKKKVNIGDSSSSLWDGFHYIGQTPTVLRIILLVGFGSTLLWSVTTLYPLFATQFGRNAGGFSQMMAANGIGAATGGMVLASFGERLPRRQIIYGGAILFSIALLIVSWVPTYALMLAILVIVGLCMMSVGVNANTRVQQQTPNHLRGRVMAVYSVVFGGLGPIGGLEVGFLAERLGAVDALRINATIALTASICIFLWSEIDYRRKAALR